MDHTPLSAAPARPAATPPAPADIERATHRAWPALRHVGVGPWTMRAAEGYTKRSNSAWLLDETAHADPFAALSAVPVIEGWYREQGLRPVFKTPDFLPAEIDALLEARGLERVDETLVLARPLDHAKRDAAPCPGCEFPDLDIWFESWKHCAGSPKGNGTHRKLLGLAAPGTLFGCATHEGVHACCGLGVPDREARLFGIFDVATCPELRRRGLASRLVRDLLHRAGSSGAEHAYLQVVRANRQARALYASLGFQEAYRYWYRVRREG